MRIFNLAKIDSGPEKQLVAEVGGTNKITKNNYLDFILFDVWCCCTLPVNLCLRVLASLLVCENLPQISHQPT